MMNERQQRFADEYIKTGNAKQSALTAGYAKQSAEKYSSGLLKRPEVQEYIQERMAEIKTNAIADQQEILEGLTRIARREEPDYTVVTVEHSENGTTEKTPQTVETPTQVKDSVRAYELLGKRHTMWTDKVQSDERKTIELTIGSWEDEEEEQPTITLGDYVEE
ncbi:terminase small subunit [Staphylococcus nepalensis]|uniref:Terminase small subunit n=2 Tax=Staphylococcus nepalensis TaxID=214473 RepID=A0ABS3L3N7_9STAP|nr:terminase small subunit [Staphylococcus nepalensis]MBO1216636.1 terminase small subunit [Staphylococcus nepalensis]MBO1227620.1 terminase small subunit [Staphylococcus nepalensis]MBO1235698.1 terminase small subunit [Staphylococcus nepalensis]MBO1237510.1 terminase small subunit [Staphylococcus nepalensis]